jgi:hypothetical protein
VQEHADSLATWVSAGGTILAAIVALGIALREQRNARAERQDRDAGQARCVTVTVAWSSTVLEITNHSQLPVRRPRIESMGDPRSWWAAPGEVSPYQDPLNDSDYSEVLPRNTTYRVRYHGQEDPDSVTIMFTDAAGLRWRRTGLGEPLRIVRPSPEAKLEKVALSTGEAVRRWLAHRLRLRR